MADRRVRVILEAVTAQYAARMAGASAATKGLGTAQKSTLATMGALRVGAIAATAGIAVGFGVAVKSSLDFERSMTRVRVNSNLTDAEINNLRESVLELAGKTGRAPKELAEGLYFLASAGLDAAQVQETLEMAAKGAAIGMGEVGDIARLTANALNAYAKDGLTATQVTDTLTAAIREGTAEPEEFANALGRILPIAQKAGVSFDEVTGSLAALSNIGLDVNEGVTAMRGLFQALVAPTTQTQTALAELGITTNQLRRIIAEDGVVAALRFLEEATGGNIDKLRDLIPNVRAITGAFGLTGQEAAKLDEAMSNVTNSQGDLNDAFQEWLKGPGAGVDTLMSRLQVLAVKVGDTMLPVFQKLVEALGGFANVLIDVVDVFSLLPAGAQQAAIGIGSLLIASKALGLSFASLGALLSPAGLIIGGLGLLTTVIMGFRKEAATSEATINSMFEALRSGEETITSLTNKIDEMNDVLDKTELPEDIKSGLAEKATANYEEAVSRLTEELKGELEQLEMIPGALTKGTKAIIERLIASKNFEAAERIMAELEEKAIERLKRRGVQMEKNTHEIQRLMWATQRHTDAIKSEEQAHRELIKQLEREDEKLIELIKTINRIPEKKHTDVTADTSQANRTVQDWVNKLKSMDIKVSVNAALGGMASGRGFRTGGEVPGSGSGDVVPAMLEPGEFVVRKEATKRNRGLLESLNAEGFQSGGLVGGPRLTFDLAKVQSAVEEARRTFALDVGGGSLVAIGRNLQGQGFLVGEHPAFGGVAPVHSPNSYHYRGRAIDVNWPGADEIARLNALANTLRATVGGIKELFWPGYDPVGGHSGHLHLAMRRGGIVTRPTKAIIGEAGPEAVIPLPETVRQLKPIHAGARGGDGAAIDYDRLGRAVANALTQGRYHMQINNWNDGVGHMTRKAERHLERRIGQFR